MEAIPNPLTTNLANDCKCVYCGFVAATQRGLKIHEASCPSKRLHDTPTTSSPVPSPAGHSDVQDPAGKQVRMVLSDLVERVRATNLETVSIAHRGNKWSVQAEWLE